MAKKKGNQKIEEARNLYCFSEDLTLQEIADQLGINVNTLYKYSTQEKWVLLKESKIKESIQFRHQILTDRKLRDIAFYEQVMDKCESLVEVADSGRELKELTSTFALAESKFFLLSRENIELIKEESSSTGDSILDELASI